MRKMAMWDYSGLEACLVLTPFCSEELIGEVGGGYTSYLPFLHHYAIAKMLGHVMHYFPHNRYQILEQT